MMIGMLIVAYILIGFVACLMFKISGDAEKIIEEKIRENKAELDEILNKLDR